mgnify:CR=1 FL=1
MIFSGGNPNSTNVLIAIGDCWQTGPLQKTKIVLALSQFILPFFLFSALAGQLADKYEKSKLIQIIKIVEILIMGFSFIGFYFENINLLSE